MGIKESLQFERQLYNLINSCGLSVDTAFYILKTVYLDFEKTLLECAKNEGENITQEEEVFKMDDKELEELKELKFTNDGTINRDNA